MTAIPMNLNIEQGTTFVFGMTLNELDSNGNVIGPKDLTGCSAAMQIRAAQGGAVQWEGTTANGKIVLGRLSYGANPVSDDPTNGRLMVIITDEDTDQLLTKKSKYDLELVETTPAPDGTVTRICKGSVTVDENITQMVTGDPDGGNDEVLT